MELSLQGGNSHSSCHYPTRFPPSLSGTLHLPIKVNEPEVLHIFGHGPWDPNYVPT